MSRDNVSISGESGHKPKRVAVPNPAIPGIFATKEAAAQAYWNAACGFFGEFARIA